MATVALAPTKKNIKEWKKYMAIKIKKLSIYLSECQEEEKEKKNTQS